MWFATLATSPRCESLPFAGGAAVDSMNHESKAKNMLQSEVCLMYAQVIQPFIEKEPEIKIMWI